MNLNFVAKKVAAYLALLLCTAEMAHGAAGDLDPSFGGTGVVRIGFGGGDDPRQCRRHSDG